MRVVCISDTHGRHAGLRLPEGDLLLHAGDLTATGDIAGLKDVNAWLAAQPHRYKIVIAGNHDFALERRPRAARRVLKDVIYLRDEEAEVEGFRIYGSPWQPRFFDWAFNLDRGLPIRERWDRIPEGVDLLATHGPPAFRLDLTGRGERVGCVDLLAAVRRVRPRVHVFGHIHESYGQLEDEGVLFVNASTCDGRMQPVNPPIVVDLEPR
jgi:predicted phosphodiesterase